MLTPTGWWFVVPAVDLRQGMDRLITQVRQELGRDPCDGAAYVFHNRASSRLKVLCVDAHGVWLSTRRLHEGRFHRVTGPAGLYTLTAAQFSWLAAGVDWQRLGRRLKDVAVAL